MGLSVNKQQAGKLGYCISVLALGLPYWLQAYDQLTLPNSLFGVGTPVMMLSALVLRGFFKLKTRQTMLAIAAAAPTVVLVRILVEVFLRPDSHNLWPFELIIACLFGLIVAAIGVVGGAIVARFTPAD